MAHTTRDKKKLLNRVRRIRGQIDAVEKALEQEKECSTILLTIAACRGAITVSWPRSSKGIFGFTLSIPMTSRRPNGRKPLRS